MRDFERFVVGGLVAASLMKAYRYFSEHYTIEIVLPSKNKDEEGPDLPILDCPMCGMPCMAGGLVRDEDDMGNLTNFYVVSCLGDHDTIAVTQAWLQEQLEKL